MPSIRAYEGKPQKSIAGTNRNNPAGTALSRCELLGTSCRMTNSNAVHRDDFRDCDKSFSFELAAM